MRIKALAVLFLLCAVDVASFRAASAASDTPASTTVRGTLVRAAGRTLIVQTRQGEQVKEVELVLGEDAELRLDGRPVKIRDLQPGMFIDATRLAANGRLPEHLVVAASRPGLGGTVVRVEGTKLIIRTDLAKEVFVETDEKTRIRRADRSEAKLADLKPGMTVRVFPATGKAERIYITRPAAPAVNAPANADPPQDREKPKTTTSAADESLIAPQAVEFLQAVAARKDDVALRLTTTAYRDAHPPEAMKKALDELRGLEPPPKMRLQVTAADPTADGSPRRAIALLPGAKSKASGERATIGMVLAFEQGGWRVDGIELLTAIGQGGIISDFQRANARGAHPVPSADAGMIALQGKVTKVDEHSISIERPPQGEGAAAEQRTLTIDAETRVSVSVAKGEQRSPAGISVPKYVSEPGKVSDVAEGQMVIVEAPLGKDHAARIFVQPPEMTVRVERPARQP